MRSVEIFEFEVSKDFLPFFNQILDEETKELILPVPFFTHKKRYRKVKAYEINGQRFYLKEYSNHLNEADSEWENLWKLQEANFVVPVPFFRRQKKTTVEITTFALQGVPLSEILPKDCEKRPSLIEALAELLSRLHNHGFYHQDCYLNHFYWENQGQTLGFLDVSRVVHRPFLPIKYQIKDLAQLGYSFEEYLGQEGKNLFENLLVHYFKFRGLKNPFFFKALVALKKFFIKRRTERARRKGIRL